MENNQLQIQNIILEWKNKINTMSILHIYNCFLKIIKITSDIFQTCNINELEILKIQIDKQTHIKNLYKDFQLILNSTFDTKQMIVLVNNIEIELLNYIKYN